MKAQDGHGNAVIGDFFQQRLEVLAIRRGYDEPCKVIPVVQDVFNHVRVNVGVLFGFGLRKDGKADVADGFNPGADDICAAGGDVGKNGRLRFRALIPGVEHDPAANGIKAGAVSRGGPTA